MNWVPKGDTALINEHGDTVAKTFDGSAWWYESHLKGGASCYGFKDSDSAKEWVSKNTQGTAQ